MTSGKFDTWLKRIWFVNGIVFFLLVLTLVVALVNSVTSDRRRNARVDPVQTTDTRESEQVAPRAVRYSEPVDIRGTNARFINVHHGSGYYHNDKEVDEVPYSSGNYAFDSRGPKVNVIFVTPDSKGHLLFDQPVVIESIDYPSKNENINLKQNWISYEVISADTNNDGKLTSDDRTDLYLTNLNGSGLKRLLDDKYDIIGNYAYNEGAQMLIYARQLNLNGKNAKTTELRQVAFLYDPATGQLKAYDALNQLTEAAGRIVGKSQPNP